jgi:hypothetical protein
MVPCMLGWDERSRSLRIASTRHSDRVKRELRGEDQMEMPAKNRPWILAILPLLCTITRRRSLGDDLSMMTLFFVLSVMGAALISERRTSAAGKITPHF